ncbi:hypothetical protein K0018_06100 [Staphylococcus massiliensis]|uniref:sugar-binding transcriptional regulator n=1 Tax=Staphylococcus massiliensis TaxID=555791 RepID=UPI001EDE048D|nr:sugar-binding domain-containing protein [Staphylococcus massiliensis]MCG3412635.1 hypothetical protein [Staphylococcus massiliensis]
MEDLIKMQQLLVPDLIDKMYRRYSILTTIEKHQPVGRRSLSEIMDVTERVLRSETNLLKAQELIYVKPTGMEVTEQGMHVIDELNDYIHIHSDLDQIAEHIKNKYQIQNVHIVPGDSDLDETVKTELGKVTSQLLESMLYEGAIVSVTGGSTMSYVSTAMRELPFKVMYTPARGGLGENVLNQANTICSKMAINSGGTYTTLYVPDQVSETTFLNLMDEPTVKNTVNKIKDSNITLHGIGDALKMAKRRHSAQDVIEKLQHHNAVGEAFGYYFNQYGEIVHKVKTIGLQLEDLKNKDNIFAVAGGKSKSNAIKAYLSIAPMNTVLITDESAVRSMI